MIEYGMYRVSCEIEYGIASHIFITFMSDVNSVQCTVYSVYSYYTHITGMDEHAIKRTTKTVSSELIIYVTQLNLNANRGNQINIFRVHLFQ